MSSDGTIAETRLPFSENDFARDPDGHIWLVSPEKKYEALSRLNNDGTLTSFPLAGYVDGTLVLGPDRNFWMGASFGRRTFIRRVTPKGDVTDFHFDSSTPVSDPVKGPGGDVWFTGGSSASGGSFVRATTSGKYVVYPLPPKALPCCTTFGTNLTWDGGSTLYAAIGYQFLGRISSTGHFDETPSPLGMADGYAHPLGFGFGPDGAIWYTADDESGDTYCSAVIGRVTTSGAVSFVQLPGAFCDKNQQPILPNAFAAGPNGTLWYTRGSLVGKLEV